MWQFAPVQSGQSIQAASLPSYINTGMNHNLVVIQAFADHSVGDLISDAEQVARIMVSDFVRYVVRIAAPDSPDPSE